MTNQQKQALKIQHDITRDGRIRNRIKSVIDASNGWSATYSRNNDSNIIFS